MTMCKVCSFAALFDRVWDAISLSLALWSMIVCAIKNTGYIGFLSLFLASL